MLVYKIYKRLSGWFRRWKTQKENELFKERVEKSEGSIGRGVEIGYNVQISGIDGVDFGDNVYIGSGSFIRAKGGLKIGDHATLSRNLVLYTINHDYEGERIPYDESYISDPVTISEGVWVGMNVTIAPGTTIGKGAIIGLGTRVFGDIPPYSIVGSPDWQQIKSRDPDRYERLKTREAFADDDGFPANL